MQTGSEMVVPSVLQSPGNLKHLVSSLNCPWHFVIPSLHEHLEHWEGTLQILQFFDEKVTPNGLADVQEFFAVRTLHFQKI